MFSAIFKFQTAAGHLASLQPLPGSRRYLAMDPQTRLQAVLDSSVCSQAVLDSKRWEHLAALDAVLDFFDQTVGRPGVRMIFSTPSASTWRISNTSSGEGARDRLHHG
jgi:hypothetical protein